MISTDNGRRRGARVEEALARVVVRVGCLVELTEEGDAVAHGGALSLASSGCI